MRALLVSLRFSPGHYSHIVALEKMFKALGFEVDLLLDRGYKTVTEASQEGTVYNLEEVSQAYEYSVIVNPSEKNEELVRILRKSPITKIIYIYHEPWDGVMQYLKEGIKQTVRAIGAHYYSRKLLRIVDWIVVPSSFALELYTKKDKAFNCNVSVIPLPFDDEAENDHLSVAEKSYFSYIGHAVKGHAFDEFIRFVRFALEREPSVNFMIATSSNLDGYLKKYRWLQEAIDRSRLKIFHGRPLSNQEINHCYQSSFCVWNLYRRSTQSGVLPKAFMFGTPVLASDIGSFAEFVQSSFNGELVSSPICFEEILLKVTHMKKNIDRYSENARMSFMKTFYYKANLSRLESTISNC